MGSYLVISNLTLSAVQPQKCNDDNGFDGDDVDDDGDDDVDNDGGGDDAYVDDDQAECASLALGLRMVESFVQGALLLD